MVISPKKGTYRQISTYRLIFFRRFAVRVRNHAKMVDCYLTTYKNNKGFFGDKKKVAQDIIGKTVKEMLEYTMKHSTPTPKKWIFYHQPT